MSIISEIEYVCVFRTMTLHIKSLLKVCITTLSGHNIDIFNNFLIFNAIFLKIEQSCFQSVYSFV